jgi:hypothetical protein
MSNYGAECWLVQLGSARQVQLFMTSSKFGTAVLGLKLFYEDGITIQIIHRMAQIFLLHQAT